MSPQTRADVRRRHSRRRSSGGRVFVGAALFVLLGVSVWLLWSVRNSRYSPSDDIFWTPSAWDTEAQTNSALQVFAGPQRPVYPYSIVPGGIQSGEELRRVIEHDPVVASHYAGFDFRHARVIELSQPKLFYLSYRMGNKVFWTAKKVTLRPGEKLITDGNISARTRCANQVAVLPQTAVSPAQPQLALLEQPIPPPVLPAFVPASYPEMPTAAGPPLPPGGYGPIPVGILPPIGYPPPPCIPPKNGKPVPGKPKPCPPGPPSPPGVPEPGTMLLFSSGVAGIYLRLRKRVHK